jgi:iron complex outermembrane receptor protein
MSLEMLSRLGYDWDNLSGPVGVDSANWQLIQAISSIYVANGYSDLPGAYLGLPGASDPPILSVNDAYFNASGLRKDHLMGATLNMPFGDGWSWNTTAYRHENKGQGIWWEGYLPTPVGAPDGSGGTISAPSSVGVRTTEYSIDRTGVTTALTWATGNHTVSAGLWIEDNDFNQARRFYGLAAAAPQRDSLEFMRDPFFTQWQYAFNTTTNQFFVQDTWAIGEELKVNFGFKTLNVENKARAIVDTRFATSLAGTIKASDDFLPQVGFNYAMNDDQEMFGAITKNMRAFIAAATGASPFATSPDNFAVLDASGLNPETSTTYEFGWRYNAADVQAVAAIYYVDFKDRLLGNTLCAGIVGCPVVLQNVGDVQTKGAEIGVRWAFADDWNWYNSLSYNESEYQDDVTRVDLGEGGIPITTIIPTGGKTVVDAPKELFRSELSYDNGTIFGKLGGSYTGKRYFTYTNDLSTVGDGAGSVPSYTVFDMNLGYRFKDFGFGKNLSIQANVTNLGDETYISTIGSNGFGNFGDNQTMLPGAPLQWFVSLNGQF